jgi:hypothetical protein
MGRHGAHQVGGGITVLLLLAACSASPGTGETTLDAGQDTSVDVTNLHLPEGGRAPDATTHDTGATSGRDAGHDATVSPPDATSRQNDAGDDADDEDASFDGNFGDVIVIGPPQLDSSIPDASPDAPRLDACGICDRVWVCNGFPDTWTSTGPQSCADIRGTTTVATLYCENGNTINYPSATGNDGSWVATATSLTLTYNDLGGGTVEIDCVPGS